MNYLEEFINTIGSLGPEAFCVVACIALGYVVKLIPFIPNKWIPPICIVAGALIYPFLTSPGRVSPDSQQPIVRIVMTGLILGVVSWMLHNSVVSRVEKWLMTKLQSGGSKRYRKGVDGQFEEIKDDTTTPPP